MNSRMYNQHQLDEIAPLLLGIGSAAARLAPWAAKAGRWAFGGSKSAKFARGAATAAGVLGAVNKMKGSGSLAGGGAEGDGTSGRDWEAYRDASNTRSRKLSSLIDPREVGYDGKLGDDDESKEPGPPERPDPRGRYAKPSKEKVMKESTINESWAKKIAGVARGVAKGAGTIGRGAMAASRIPGAKAVAGGAVLGGALAARSKFLKNRKADSSATYGGGGSNNPYARRSIMNRMTENENVQEGIIGGALKGAALAGAGYAAYRGAKALRNPETRANIGGMARKVGGAVRGGISALASKWKKAKPAG